VKTSDRREDERSAGSIRACGRTGGIPIDAGLSIALSGLFGFSWRETIIFEAACGPDRSLMARTPIADASAVRISARRQGLRQYKEEAYEEDDRILTRAGHVLEQFKASL